MGVRIRNEFKTLAGVEKRVDVWDSDYGGSILTGFKENGFELEYEHPDRFLSPLIPSSCYYTLYDDGSGDFTAFKADLTNAQEDEFKLIVYTKVSDSWVLDWAGVIMSDLVSWDNTAAPRPFEIVAKCGLNRLEGIMFDKINAAPYTSDPLQKIIKILFDCLSYSGTAQFWNGSTKPYITCNNQWHDVLQTSIPQADIFNYIRLGKEFLIEDSSKPADGKQMYGFRAATDAPMKTKDVLSQILQLFALRITLSEGSWHIQQLPQFTNTSYSMGTYDYLGAYLGAVVGNVKLTENGSTLAVLAGGKFGHYPPVKIARAKVYPSDILKGTFGLASPINKDNLTFTSSTFALGAFYGGADLRLQINIHCATRIWNSLVCGDFYVEVKAKLTLGVVGNHRIKNPDPEVLSVADWTTTAADEYIYEFTWGKSHFARKDLSRREDVISILTDEIPSGEHIDCTLVITCTLKSYSGLTNWPAVSDLNLFFDSVDISLYDYAVSPPVFGQISELEYESPHTAANSIDIDYGFLRIADNVGQQALASFNSIMVMQPGAAGTLARSTNWVAGYTANTGLVATLLKETIALQKTAIKKYTGAFAGSIYNAWNSILYDSEIWVFMGGRYNAKDDEWDGEWFSIAHDFTISTTTTTRVRDSIGDGKINPVGTWKPIDPHKMLPVGPVGLGVKVTKDAQGGTVTSIDTEALPYDHIRNGDTILLLNPNNMGVMQEFTVDADADAGDTSISVVSDTADVDLWQSAVVAHDPRKVVASQILRGNELQINQAVMGRGNGTQKMYVLKCNTVDAATIELTTDGGTGSGTTNRIPIPVNCSLSCDINITCKDVGTANVKQFVRTAVFANNGAMVSLEGQTAVSDSGSSALIGADIAISANATDNCVKIEVTGVNLTQLRWAAAVNVVISKD